MYGPLKFWLGLAAACVVSVDNGICAGQEGLQVAGESQWYRSYNTLRQRRRQINGESFSVAIDSSRGGNHHLSSMDQGSSSSSCSTIVRLRVVQQVMYRSGENKSEREKAPTDG